MQEDFIMYKDIVYLEPSQSWTRLGQLYQTADDHDMLTIRLITDTIKYVVLASRDGTDVRIPYDEVNKPELSDAFVWQSTDKSLWVGLESYRFLSTKAISPAIALCQRIGINVSDLLNILEAMGYDVTHLPKDIFNQSTLQSLRIHIDHFFTDYQRHKYILKKYDAFAKELLESGTSVPMVWNRYDHVGIVTSYIGDRGFGFIESPEHSKIFFHINSVKDKQVLKESTVVGFKLKNSPRGLNAVTVTPLHNEPIDYRWLYKYACTLKRSPLKKTLFHILPSGFFAEMLSDTFEYMLDGQTSVLEFENEWQYIKEYIETDKLKNYLIDFTNIITETIEDIDIQGFILSNWLPIGGKALFESLFLSQPPKMAMNIEVIRYVHTHHLPWLNSEIGVALQKEIYPNLTSEDHTQLFKYATELTDSYLRSLLLRILPISFYSELLTLKFQSVLANELNINEYCKIWLLAKGFFEKDALAQCINEISNLITQTITDNEIQDFIITHWVPVGGQKLFESLLLAEPPKLPMSIEVELDVYANSRPWLNDEARLSLQAQLYSKFTAEDRIRLYIAGHFTSVSYQDILECDVSYNNRDLRKFVKSTGLTIEEKVALLDNNLIENPDENNYKDVVSIGEDELTEYGIQLLRQNWKQINSNNGLHFLLWRLGENPNTPYEYLQTQWLNGECFDELDVWKAEDKFDADILIKNLWENVLKFKSIQNARDFSVLTRHLIAIYNLDKTFISKNNSAVDNNITPFIAIALWLDCNVDSLILDDFKRVLVYLEPARQIKAIRKLFYFKKIDKIHFEVPDLKDIVRIDEDIYNLNLNQNPNVFLDISIAIVVSLLASLREKGTYFGQSELITIALKNITGDRTKKFAVKDLFEECRGRTDCKTSIKGKVTKGKNEAGQDCFVLNFSYDPGLVAAVKSAFTQRTYSKTDKTWIVPGHLEKEVLGFAQKHGFILKLSDEETNIPVSAMYLELKDTPQGILFCEGKKSRLNDTKFNIPYWWCLNQKCFKNCETLHTPEQWEQFTLLDFLSILGYNISDSSKQESIDKDKYYQFIGTINRFNTLMEHMYCNDCNEILSPSRSSNFAHYRVTQFHCTNPTCLEHGNDIYLHHCMNGRCANIIDSRLSQKCPNGWYICDNTECGCCCSHEQYERQLAKPRDPSLALRDAVANKIGHLERAMHYCYKCGDLMREGDDDTFKCEPCGVEYNLKKNFFKRPHRNWKQTSNESPPPSPNSDSFFPDKEY